MAMAHVTEVYKPMGHSARRSMGLWANGTLGISSLAHGRLCVCPMAVWPIDPWAHAPWRPWVHFQMGLRAAGQWVLGPMEPWACGPSVLRGGHQHASKNT